MVKHLTLTVEVWLCFLGPKKILLYNVCILMRFSFSMRNHWKNGSSKNEKRIKIQLDHPKLTHSSIPYIHLSSILNTTLNKTVGQSSKACFYNPIIRWTFLLKTREAALRFIYFFRKFQ